MPLTTMLAMDTRVAFSLFGLDVYWYGVLITLGMVLATYVAANELKRYGYNPQILWDGAILILGLGVLGGRMYHVFSTYNDGTPGWPYYREHPLAIITEFRNGGLGIYGGIVGGAIGAIIVCIRNKVPFGVMANAIGVALPLGQLIGRWGNYANQELYGPPTNLPWGIRIDEWARVDPYRDLAQYPLDTHFHPSFLYESIWNFIGLIVLLWAARRFQKQLRGWDVFALYAIWYGIGRGLLEATLRVDAYTYGFGSIPPGVAWSLAFIGGGLIVLFWNHVIARPKSAQVPLPASN